MEQKEFSWHAKLKLHNFASNNSNMQKVQVFYNLYSRFSLFFFFFNENISYMALLTFVSSWYTEIFFRIVRKRKVSTGSLSSFLRVLVVCVKVLPAGRPQGLPRVGLADSSQPLQTHHGTSLSPSAKLVDAKRYLRRGRTIALLEGWGRGTGEVRNCRGDTKVREVEEGEEEEEEGRRKGGREESMLFA